MTTLIRPARPGDGAGLADCWVDVGRHYTELAPELFQVPVADGLAESYEASLARPRGDDALWLVAEVDARVLGSLSARIEPPIADADRQFVRRFREVRAVVDAVYVRGDLRRQGVGSLLMEHAERWARERGAASMTLDTWVGSPTSVPFYEQRMGFRRRAIVFEKRL